MQKQYIPAALALILALSAGSSYAPASPLEDGGCPPLFTLVPAFSGQRADHNGDGYVCKREITTGPLARIIFIDNRFPS